MIRLTYPKLLNLKNKKSKMEKENSNIFVIIFCSLILLICSVNLISAAQNSESYKPYIHKPSVVQSPKLQMYGNYQTQLFSRKFFKL